MGKLNIRYGNRFYDACVNPMSFYKDGAWHSLKDGDHIFFNGEWQELTCNTIILNPFDYAVLSYQLMPGGGQDLDTFTGMYDNGTIYDNTYVGFGQGSKIPNNSTNPFLTWGGDNTSNNGVESVLVNFNAISEEFPDLETIKIRMNAVWYSSKGTGDIQVALKTYLGGTMQQNGYDFVNIGGDIVDNFTIYRNVQVQSHNANINQSSNVGNVTYDVETKQAMLI